MLTYCVKCRTKTKNLNPKIFTTKNGGLIKQNVLNVELKGENLWKNKKQKDYWVI